MVEKVGFGFQVDQQHLRATLARMAQIIQSKIKLHAELNPESIVNQTADVYDEYVC